MPESLPIARFEKLFEPQLKAGIFKREAGR
jgi:hypothetical protein